MSITKPITYILSIIILTTSIGYYAHAQNNPRCINGQELYSNKLIKGFSFCFNNSIQITDTIHEATQPEQYINYQATTTSELKLTGKIELKINNSKVLFELKEGIFNSPPKRYCTPKDLTNSTDIYGSLFTPKGGYVDVGPTLVGNHLNSFSQPYNGGRDQTNNILYPIDPYINSPKEIALPFDPKLNTYINADKNFADQYPFTLSLGGHQLQANTSKDQKIISNLNLNLSTLDIASQGLSTANQSLTLPENAQMLNDLKKGNGRCFDNNHRLYGIPIGTQTILNPQHSSGYGINPEIDDGYSETIIGLNSSQPLLNTKNNLSLKVYANTNILQPFISTLESICWNDLSCYTRDNLISRPSSQVNLLPARSLSRDAQDLLQLRSDSGRRSQEDNIKNTNDPYFNQYAELTYTIHCDSKPELTSSNIPPPILKELNQSRSDSSQFTLTITSVHKTFPLKVKTYTDECNKLDLPWFVIPLQTVKATHYQEHIIPKGLDHIQLFTYKNSTQLQDEEISHTWIEGKDKSTITQNLSQRATQYFFIDPTSDQSKVTDSDELYARTRVYGDFTLSNLTSKENQNINFNYSDIKEKVIGLSAGKYLNESEKSNILRPDRSIINTNTDDNKTQIDATMYVKGDRSDRTRSDDFQGYARLIRNVVIGIPSLLRKQKETTKIVEEYQPFGFKLLNSGVDRLKYNQKSNVWIISHGYKDKFGGDFQTIGDQIIKDHPGDIVLGLDWSNISDKDANTVDSLSYDICRVPTWIRPISQVIYNRLKNWGFDDSSKLNLIGHSLGTIMSAEIAQRFIESNKGKPNKMVLLDPPSETRCKLRFNQYTVQSIPSIPKVQSFASRANYSYSFVGNHSLAGNEQMAITAHRSYWMEYGNWNDLGKEQIITTNQKVISQPKTKTPTMTSKAKQKEPNQHPQLAT
jgi:hypothetical protein